ncbi:restriction endonuclease subunit S [Flagellimonas marinaquae]|uniref:restriction endonuclease subunit S n=1 Tax=Flagellimonas marinaquae TaxID=254955 RepID=UPI0019D1DC0E|nr:restriction endonuclease subunit S [Allomuricauda aquimarina]
MSEWKEVELSELINFGNGKKKPESEGDIPIYGGNGILGFSADSNYEDETIIIGRVGAYCGSVYYENKPIWVSDNALAAKAKNGNSTKFLYYFLKNANLNQHAGGSSHPLVTQTLLNSLEYEVCIDETEQNSIAEVLSSLDDKIDLLHRQNQTLEQMAETLFRQWFVEEAEFVSDRQLIIGDLIESVSITHKFPNKEIVFLNTSDIYLGDVLTHSTTEVIGLPGQAKKTIKKGDILFSEIRPANGRYAFIDFEAENYVVSTKLMVLRNKNVVSQEFIYFYLINPKTIQELQLIAESRSGTFPQITFDNLKDFRVNVPSDEKLLEAESFCKEVIKKIKSNQTQIRTLTALRDTLLPKLMNGEVRVQSQRDETFVEKQTTTNPSSVGAIQNENHG